MATTRVELLVVGAVATAITVAIAMPVLLAPSQRLFGAEIVGRHHDPFTAMERFAGGGAILFAQPVTDTAGAWLSNIVGPVAAFNMLVLSSFPLAAIAAYLLARHLTIPTGGAVVAALAFAFSPFHVAQAAYHLHVAQTQWIPLYLLALWRCLDTASPAAMALLAAATVAVVLSNFYGGLIMAAVTPAAVGAYWLVCSRTQPDAPRRLALTCGVLLGIATTGSVYVGHLLSGQPERLSLLAFPRADLFQYSATWRSYFIPPVAHPLLGDATSRFWSSAGVSTALLEQQVTLGSGIVILAGVAAFGWWRGRNHAHALWPVPLLTVVALAAFVCSLAPEARVWGVAFMRPSGWLYDAVPMFRAYARFGVVVQLMAAMLAGCGLSYLWRAGTRRARIASIALVALTVAEYAVSSANLSRDVLPTAAHRWVMSQDGAVRAFDCAPLDMPSVSVPWLTHARVVMGDALSDCTEPRLRERLSALGFTHLLVRRQTADGTWMLARRADELTVATDQPDGQVLLLPTTKPQVYAGDMSGFFRREHDDSWSWRWMGSTASWTLVNTGESAITMALDVEMAAFDRSRALHIAFSGRPVQLIDVDPGRRLYRLGPLTMMPGAHALTFRAATPPTSPASVSGTDDQRLLSVAVGTWQWRRWGDTP